MLVTLNEVLKDTKKQKYAVGLFNTINLEMAKAVIAAAEEMKSPVMVGPAEVLLKYATIEELTYFLKPMAEKAKVPVVLHLDHGLSKDLVLKAMDLGYSSVMYDCSVLDYETNIKEVAEIVEVAHKRNISVEAELGHVGSNETSAESHMENDVSYFTQPEEAKNYVEKSGCDALAVSIGNAHGAYKQTPKLQIELLKELNASCGDIPLVLHGGSGLTVEDFKNCIANGIGKVNIFTDINCAQADSIASDYKKGCGMTDVMENAIEAIKVATIKKMEIFESIGKA